MTLICVYVFVWRENVHECICEEGDYTRMYNYNLSIGLENNFIPS